jgi:hypothetical protein
MSTFYVNKKGLDSASAGGHPDAIPLKYKDLKGTTEFTLFTKPVSIKKMQAATSLSEYFLASSFPRLALSCSAAQGSSQSQPR